MMRTILTRRTILAAVLATALPLAFVACGSDDDGSGGEGTAVTVVASTTQVADLARNVGGDRAAVVGLLAPNADPHDYDPRPSDVASVGDADLVLQSGGDIDLWVEGLVESSGSGAAVVELLDSVETIEGDHEHADEDEDGDEHADEDGDEHADEDGDEHADEDGDEHADEDADGDEHADDEIDPHWWQDPTNAVLAVEEIRDRLIEVDPDGRADYEANAADYVADLEQLHSTIAECMSEVSPRERKLVTSHDALGYFANRYEIEVVGAAIPALTTQAQPSAGETAELVDLVRDEEIKAVFPEAGVSSRLQDAIAGETDAVVGGELWADTLGPEGSGAETYLEAMAANAATLALGFSGGERGCPAEAEAEAE